MSEKNLSYGIAGNQEMFCKDVPDHFEHRSSLVKDVHELEIEVSMDKACRQAGTNELCESDGEKTAVESDFVVLATYDDSSGEHDDFVEVNADMHLSSQLNKVSFPFLFLLQGGPKIVSQ